MRAGTTDHITGARHAEGEYLLKNLENREAMVVMVLEAFDSIIQKRPRAFVE
jgi:hypothetical protein